MQGSAALCRITPQTSRLGAGTTASLRAWVAGTPGHQNHHAGDSDPLVLTCSHCCLMGSSGRAICLAPNPNYFPALLPIHFRLGPRHRHGAVLRPQA